MAAIKAGQQRRADQAGAAGDHVDIAFVAATHLVLHGAQQLAVAAVAETFAAFELAQRMVRQLRQLPANSTSTAGGNAVGSTGTTAVKFAACATPDVQNVKKW